MTSRAVPWEPGDGGEVRRAALATRSYLAARERHGEAHRRTVAAARAMEAAINDSEAAEEWAAQRGAASGAA